MKAVMVIAAVCAVLAMACGKGELDAGTLTDNPFDPAYDGPSVFVADSTYIVLVNVNGTLTPFQAIAFHVREELFTAPAAYSVRMLDRSNGVVYILEPNPANSNRFTYIKGELQLNVQVCLELRLYNNLSAARPDDICVTLTP
jgi:hypothetical protein